MLILILFVRKIPVGIIAERVQSSLGLIPDHLGFMAYELKSSNLCVGILNMGPFFIVQQDVVVLD